ncbi:hypothetical protein DMUE_0418 [Dictyocoela muelleri]|nr:hypothetical protein DMUE_0418 [Dictyocoela muelleri]
MFDETNDVNSRNVLNILCSFCRKYLKKIFRLLRTIELSKTNNVTVGLEIINIMFEIYEGDINYNKLHIILSDAATGSGAFLLAKEGVCFFSTFSPLITHK